MPIPEYTLGQVGFGNLIALMLAAACLGRASKRKMKPLHRWTITQENRYWLTLLGVACGTLASGYLVHQYGLHATYLTMREEWSLGGSGRYLLALLVGSALCPLIGAVMWLWIYNWPAKLARRVKPSWYVTTRSIRNYMMAPEDLKRTLIIPEDGEPYIDYLPAA